MVFPSVLSHNPGTHRTSNTLFCPEMRNGHRMGVLLCGGSQERTATREEASSQNHGEGQESEANGEHGLDCSIASTKEQHWMGQEAW